MSSFSLVCPYLMDQPSFSRGVELGLLYGRMQQESEIADYFILDNQDQILLLASRLGWNVKEMWNWDAGWFFCHLARRQSDDSM